MPNLHSWCVRCRDEINKAHSALGVCRALVPLRNSSALLVPSTSINSFITSSKLSVHQSLLGSCCPMNDSNALPNETTALAVRSARTPPTSSTPPSKARLAKSISAFEKELNSDGRRMSPRFKALRKERLSDSHDVLRVVEQINQECAEHHGSASRRSYAIMLTPILERIRQFAPIGDVLVRGAQDMLVSGVWAAVRLALEVPRRCRESCCTVVTNASCTPIDVLALPFVFRKSLRSSLTNQ